MRKITTARIKIVSILGLLLLGSLIASAEPSEPSYAAKSYPRRFAMGLVRTAASRNFIKTAPRTSFLEDGASIPQKFSLQEMTGPIEDQRDCGSCWDFALTTTLRGTHMTNGKDPGRLSFNYLLNCATTMSGCDGGDFTAASYLISPLGAPAYGSDGPYIAAQSKCKTKPVVASTVSYKFLGTDLGLFPQAAAPSFKDIAYVVGVLHRPVSVDVAVDEAWMSYYYGVYDDCVDNEADINHMVVIEGYDCQSSVDQAGNCIFDANGNLPPGVGTWLIRNSWGVGWGDHGYITTKATDKKGRRCNAVATDALFFDLQN